MSLWLLFFSCTEDDFKPDSDDDDDDDDVSSGVDENDVSEPESESEHDSPVKVTYLFALCKTTSMA